jgi:c-di-GMP-binding flagellar brake protein YcgR
MNYDRYFSRGQKVYLINISQTRDESVYESLSATVVSCNDSSITIKAPYRLFSGDATPLETGMQFKLSTESFGVGVQLRAELVAAPAAEILELQPIGQMEIYQRRQMPRVDVSLPFLHVLQKSSLSAFKREWRRVVTDLRQPTPPRLKLQETKVNISAGGIRFELNTPPTPLAIVVFDLQDGAAPVCAVAELAWHKTRQEDGVEVCGHRFLEILKEDQARLASFVDKLGGGGGRIRDNWDLLDKMMSDQGGEQLKK